MNRSKMLIIYVVVYCLTILIFTACNNSEYKIKTVDFSENIDSSSFAMDTTKESIGVIVAAMISPKETFSYYKELFDYISRKANITLRFEQRKTFAEANELLAKQQVDIGFICSGAYIRNKENCNLLVVPVFKGRPYYQAYIITNKKSSINTFNDLKGKSFAFTDPLSNTGKFYPEKRINQLYHRHSADFFSKTTYTHSHDASIQLVSKGLVDGASVDGLIYEYLLFNSPERVKNIKIIEKSELFGSPPVVTSTGIDKNLKIKLREILLKMHTDSVGKKILNKLMIDRFEMPSDSIYNRMSLYYNNLKNDTL